MSLSCCVTVDGVDLTCFNNHYDGHRLFIDHATLYYGKFYDVECGLVPITIDFVSYMIDLVVRILSANNTSDSTMIEYTNLLSVLFELRLSYKQSIVDDCVVYNYG